MTVVHPNHIVGINSITVLTGDSLSIHKNDGSLIRTIVSNTGVSTFHAVEVSKGGGDLTVGISTLFVDNSAGRIGIGTVSPNKILTVRGSSTPEILLKPIDASPAIFVGDTIRTSEGQHLAEYRGNWDGTTVGRMVIVAGDDTGNKDNGEITFNTAAAGSTIERLRITSSGQVLIGDNPTVDANTNLHIEEASGECGVVIEGNTGGAGAYLLLKNNSTSSTPRLSLIHI